MAILEKDRMHKRPQIDLTGPEGNVFVIIGYARQYAKQLDLDSASIVKDMMSSDYEHAVQVFDDHFGDYVDLLR